MIGAGIAGTTCARELHKLGHEVEIFEMSAKDKPTRPRQMEGSINLLQNIPEIEPKHHMKSVKLHSPNVTAFLKGKLGFLYEVGGTNGIDAKARKDVEQRLPIHYSTRIENKMQLEKFQVVVAADGYRSLVAREAGLVSRTSSQKGVGFGFTVKGDFDPELIEVWLGNHFSFHGYAYVIPFSRNEASLVSASIGKTMPQTPYRERLKELAKTRNWELQEEWVDFESWHDFSSYAFDNLYVAGNAGSFIEPAFGFGLKWAVLSAKLCARAIHENTDYNLLLRKELLPDFESFQIMRRFFDVAEKADYDKYVSWFKNPLVKRLAESGKSLFQHKRLVRAIFSKT